ncbi:cytochrome c oxidase assembly protein, partial [Verticillium dahliae]
VCLRIVKPLPRDSLPVCDGLPSSNSLDQQGKPYLASPAIGAMSRASKLTLMGTSFFALGTIIMVHFQQRSEKQASANWRVSAQAMHQGVLRDMEQQRVKRERQLDFDLQRALEQEYKREQTVRDSTNPDSSQSSTIS